MTTTLSFSSVRQFVGVNLRRTNRAIVLMLVVTSLISVHAVRLAYLQLFEGEYHRQRAEQNRIRPIPLPSDRGNILDRNGKVFAANRLARSVYLWPKEQTPQQWQVTAAKLSQILNIPASEILQKLEEVGYQSKMPVRIIRDIDVAAFVGLQEQFNRMGGIEIRGESSRYYPNGSLASHVIGYIGEASLEELQANPDYPMGMIVGRMGIERVMNDQLSGKWGSRLIEVEASGQEIRELGERSAQAGADIHLTLDLELQKTAEKFLANRRGAVVVLDVKTGAILAMASGPTFDPNIFTGRFQGDQWEKLISDENNPLLNRALQGYPPGSTFKIVTAAAGMQSGKFSPDSMLYSSSSINVGGISFHEHGSGYGLIGFVDALAYSSNTFFYQLGISAGPEEIAKWGSRLGVGETTDLNLLGLEGGTIGSIPTPGEKEELYGEPWYVGDTVTMAIGQGLVLLTPLEEAVMISTIANGGNRVKPHLLTSQTNTPLTKPEPTGLKPETIAVIRQGLTAVVQKGTAQQLNDGSIPLTAGKTGTAEVRGQEDNAMYVGFGPVNDPQIAVAVVVENGGYGAVSAVPIAHEIYKTYFKGKAK